MKKKFLFTLLALLTLCGCGGNNGSSSSISTSNTSVTTSNNNTSISSAPSSSSSEVTTSISSNVSSETSSHRSSNSSIEVSSQVSSSTSSQVSSEVSSATSSQISSNVSSSPSSQLSSEGSSSSSSSQEEIKPLQVPDLRFNNETRLVTWDQVEGATHYNYSINGGEVLTTTSLALELNDKTNVTVQAANEKTTSKWSKAITCYDTSEQIVDIKGNVNVYYHNTTYSPITITQGSVITRPSDPVKDNYVFDNWYSDPFYQTLFDFSKPIDQSTIIYANYTPTSLINDVYFWIKADAKMTSSVQSSSSGWKFIPLHLQSTSSPREFSAIVNVSGASSSTPCNFIIMDGFDDLSGRTYWKCNNQDFAITASGTYKITFSLETQYQVNGYITQVKYEVATNSASSLLMKNDEVISLETPLISVDENTNIASWNVVEGATKYEVVIDNADVLETTVNYISLNKGSHISIRAIGTSNRVSSWSLPNANISKVYEDLDKLDYAYVYFYGSDINSIKVNLGEQIQSAPTLTKANYTFEGWYLDLSLSTKANFPYTVNENIVFYPKWTYNGSYENDAYYKLVDASGNLLTTFTWNYDNLSYYEYQSQVVNLTKSTNYYVKTLDDSRSWGPYTVSENSKYKIFFSEDYFWSYNGEQRNVYIRDEILTFYFSRPNNWGTGNGIYAYIWNDTTNAKPASWPGQSMTWIKNNEYGEGIFKIEFDRTLYDRIIFTNNKGQQTIDIVIQGIYEDKGFYVSGQDGSKYTVATYKYEG